MEKFVRFVPKDGAPKPCGGRAVAEVVALGADGEPVDVGGEGYTLPAATTEKMGGVKKASATTAVASADAAAAATDTVTKAEFDAVVALANECKKQLNDLLAKLKAAGQMA